jgi:hypothetical protein
MLSFSQKGWSRPALQPSSLIPFMLLSVRNIPGEYWDGGITDYHLHSNYAIDLIAARAVDTCAEGRNDTDNGP